jgi:hypothetical protein
VCEMNAMNFVVNNPVLQAWIDLGPGRRCVIQEAHGQEIHWVRVAYFINDVLVAAGEGHDVSQAIRNAVLV